VHRKVAIVVAACVLVFGKAAFAHRIDEYLQAMILSLEGNPVQASMRLILCSARARYLTIATEGKSVPPQLISWSFPQPAQMRDGLGEHIEYAMDLVRCRSTPSGKAGVWLNGVLVASLFHLGMRHIADGTDRLLFFAGIAASRPASCRGSPLGCAYRCASKAASNSRHCDDFYHRSLRHAYPRRARCRKRSEPSGRRC
jgi:hypothetical protein